MSTPHALRPEPPIGLRPDLRPLDSNERTNERTKTWLMSIFRLQTDSGPNPRPTRSTR